jgi:hypothetical protein
MNGSARGTALVVVLLGVPVLAVSMALARAGSARAVLCWLGAAAYMLYDSVLFLFLPPFNRLFLLDVAMLGLAAWSAGTVLWQTDVAGLGRRSTETAPVREMPFYVWVIITANAVVWLNRIESALISGAPAGDRPAHQPGVRPGPGAVAAADRGRRGVAVTAPALGLPGHRRDPGHVGPGKHRRGRPVVRSCGRPGLLAGVRGWHADLRGARADRADTRLLPVPRPAGPGTRTREPPITSRWLSTAPVACDPGNVLARGLSGGLYTRRSSSSVRFR